MDPRAQVPEMSPLLDLQNIQDAVYLGTCWRHCVSRANVIQKSDAVTSTSGPRCAEGHGNRVGLSSNSRVTDEEAAIVLKVVGKLQSAGKLTRHDKVHYLEDILARGLLSSHLQDPLRDIPDLQEGNNHSAPSPEYRPAVKGSLKRKAEMLHVPLPP